MDASRRPHATRPDARAVYQVTWFTGQLPPVLVCGVTVVELPDDPLDGDGTAREDGDQSS
jgi:hypothetical protein